MRPSVLFVLLIGVSACDEALGVRTPTGSGSGRRGNLDAGRRDLGEGDGGETLDTGGSDLGLEDRGLPKDSGLFADLGSGTDGGGPSDGAGDAATAEGGPADGPENDAGGGDHGPADIGVAPLDFGVLDLGVVADAGSGSDEVWVQIDYTSAFSPQSPSWSFSNTTGFGPAEWAMAGDTWPEAWDRFNNMTVGSDPIGQTLHIGSGSELQLMIGLEELISYQYATVELIGRSRATSSGVDFDVYNPLNNCGTSGHMSQDWTPDVVELDLSTCLLTGAGVEAVRLQPTNGTVALISMRVTLHGAVVRPP